MRIKPFIFFVLPALVIALGYSCSKDEQTQNWPDGQYNQQYVQNLKGFEDQRDGLLAQESMSLADFITFSTDSAWHLTESNRARLREFRDAISFPDSLTVIQKIIALEDVGLYMNNTYGGTVGGFVSESADVKSLETLSDVYYGMRLDYPGTKFLPAGGGYAVLRFTSNSTAKLSVPYCEEMGGTRAHAWPNTGGGFTASTLGDGGFPEYAFDSYYAPNQGGELYEVTPLGNEILRAQYIGTGWVTTEPTAKSTGTSATLEMVENPVRNGIYARAEDGAIYPVIGLPGGRWQIWQDAQPSPIRIRSLVTISTFADYKGFTFRVRGFDGYNYHLITNDISAMGILSLNIVEKSLFGIKVPVNEVNKVWERISE